MGVTIHEVFTLALCTEELRKGSGTKHADSLQQPFKVSLLEKPPRLSIVLGESSHLAAGLRGYTSNSS